jgi:cytochrome d ubiquinol oxidase subunit I
MGDREAAGVVHGVRLSRPAAEKTHFAIKIPYLTGLIATRSVDTPVTGIKELKREHEARIRNGMKAYAALQRLKSGDRSPTPAEFDRLKDDLGYGLLLKKYTTNVVDATPSRFNPRSTTRFRMLPDLLVVSHHGRSRLWFLFVFGAAFIVLARRNLAHNRWVMKLAMWSIPLPWIAIELGWIVAEYGRQPWTISGCFHYLSVSSVTLGQVCSASAASSPSTRRCSWSSST